MKRLLLAAVLILLGGPAAIIEAEDSRAEAESFFEAKIRPVLAGTCAKCHGASKAGNNLRLDSRDASLKGGDSGPAVVPGAPDGSLLLATLRYHGDVKMPPEGPLSHEVVADFERWVRDGAVWPASRPNAVDPFRQQAHWAFQPLTDVIVPRDRDSSWPQNEIDQFILTRMREEGLTPNTPADARILLRRACFDLTGLPPSVEQQAEFLGDRRPDAFARLVDRLLGSPEYGERWGRHWMDVVHYSDTAGDNTEFPVPELYLYRDYIIDAFNADMPFDQFVREQVAGDILAKAGSRERFAEQVIATGFLALARSYGLGPDQETHLKIEDTLETVGSALLGINFRCARCHDHKFDPLTTKEYYGMYAIFAATKYPWAGSEYTTHRDVPRQDFAPLIPAAEAEPRIAAYRESLKALEARVKQAEKEKTEPKALEALKLELRRLKRPGLPDNVPVAYAVSDGNSTQTPIQSGGDPLRKAELVSATVPAFLPCTGGIQFPRNSSGRLQLAEWITDEKNPLTARVIVNRVWQHHFGRGIVSTPSNFGLSGDPPSHPELLDWLTRQFIDGGWSIKKLHRLIMLSKTYQLSSELDPYKSEIDPQNRFCWRFNRRRLDAESLRDSMLTVSGELDSTRPEGHPFPPMETWTFEMAKPFAEFFPSNHRTVYLITLRLQRHPYLSLFDGADPCVTTADRTESTVPLQALFLKNSEFVQSAAAGLASRLEAGNASPRDRISLAHRLAFARMPTEHELERGVDYVTRYSEAVKRSAAIADQADHLAWSSYAKTILAANEFRYID